jgi:hypothetical protein
METPIQAKKQVPNKTTNQTLSQTHQSMTAGGVNGLKLKTLYI